MEIYGIRENNERNAVSISFKALIESFTNLQIDQNGRKVCPFGLDLKVSYYYLLRR